MIVTLQLLALAPLTLIEMRPSTVVSATPAPNLQYSRGRSHPGPLDTNGVAICRYGGLRLEQQKRPGSNAGLFVRPLMLRLPEPDGAALLLFRQDLMMSSSDIWWMDPAVRAPIGYRLLAE